MLKEFLDRVVELALLPTQASTLEPKSEPPHVYYLRNPHGQIERMEAEPQPRAHTASSLGTIAKLAKFYGVNIDAVIWYSRAGVVLICNDENRRDKVTFPLTFSPQLQALAPLEKTPRPMKQLELIRFLKVSLAGCLARTGNLLTVLKKLKFRTATDGNSEISQGKASIGKSLEASLTGEGAIPETIELDVPIFKGQNWRALMTCALEADPLTESFFLLPLAGETEKCIRVAESLVECALLECLTEVGSKCPVYYGVP